MQLSSFRREHVSAPSVSERSPSRRDLEDLCREYNSVWLEALYEGLVNCSPEEFESEQNSVLEDITRAILVLKEATRAEDESHPAPKEFLDTIERLTLFLSKLVVARPR